VIVINNPKLTKLINIGGHKVSVFTDEHLLADRGNYAEWCYRDLSIVINGTSPPTVRKQSLLHETIEAINEIHELNLSHNKIKTLTSALFQVLNDNSEFFNEV
jgi:hypothetical protein